MQLQARDKRALIAGAAIIVALLAYLLWPRASADTNVELVPAAQRQNAAAVPTQSPPLAPAPAMPAGPPAASTLPIVAAPVAGPPEGLRLNGVTGSGAIFGFADGSQRFVPRGREVVPGLALQAVTLRHVLLASGTSLYRLGFGGPAAAVQPPAGSAPVVGAPLAR